MRYLSMLSFIQEAHIRYLSMLPFIQEAQIRYLSMLSFIQEAMVKDQSQLLFDRAYFNMNGQCDRSHLFFLNKLRLYWLDKSSLDVYSIFIMLILVDIRES